MLTTINNFMIETIFSIESETELILSFRDRDQKKLILPKNLRFPLSVRSYFTWKEPSGVYTYLVYKHPSWDLPKGIAFKRMDVSGEQTGRLCCWCNSYGSSEEVGFLSATMSPSTSATYILCQDLRCIEKIEEASALNGRSADKAVDQLYQRIRTFFEGLVTYKQ